MVEYMNKKVSIVIPAYNEQERLDISVRRILKFITKEKLDAELILVDDGSSDETTSVAQSVCDEFPQIDTKVIRYEENRGKGFAVRTGMLKSVGETVVFSDADLSTPISEIYKLVKPIESGKIDVAFGSRALNRNLIGVRQPWRREQSGKVFNLIVRTLTGLPFWDTQCGFKAFNMKKFRPLLGLMQIERFGFDVEFLFVADLHELKLKEIPVRWNHEEGTKVDVFRDSQRMFREVMMIRKFAKKGIYNLSESNEFRELIEVANQL